MKYLLISCICCAALNSYGAGWKKTVDHIVVRNEFKKISPVTDSLPNVFPKNHVDIIAGKLKLDAAVGFGVNQLPGNKKDWEKRRTELRSEIIKKTGVVLNHNLALNMKETGTIQ